MLLLAALVVPGVSLAQTQSVAQLQQEIAALTAQIQQLEAQLAAQGGTASWCYTFDSNLSIGMSGAAVTALQTALQKDGETVTVNGSFDDQTAAGVTSFQEKYASDILVPNGLSNGTGYAGRATRTKLDSLFGCAVTTPIISNPSAAAPYITGTDSTGIIVPGANVVVNGQNFDSGSYIDLDGTQTLLPYYYSATSLSFALPTSVSVGSHTIWVGEKASSVTSNKVTLTVN